MPHRSSPRPAPWIRWLPVALLAVMVLVGLGLEWTLFQGPRILTKLPLIALLLLPLLRWLRSRREV